MEQANVPCCLHSHDYALWRMMGTASLLCYYLEILNLLGAVVQGSACWFSACSMSREFRMSVQAKSYRRLWSYSFV